MKKSVKDYKNYRCPVAGCEHKARSVPGLSAHWRKAHPKEWKGTIKASLRKIGKDDLVIEVDAAGIARSQKPRRSYQRHKPQRALQRAATREQVNFCPKCGCNMEAVGVAMAFAAAQ